MERKNMTTRNKALIGVFILTSLVLPIRSAYALDPSKFIRIDKTQLSIGDGFFDEVTHLMGVTVEQVSGDAGAGKQFVTYKINDHSEKIEFNKGDCPSGFEVSKISAGEEHRTLFYKSSNHKIEVQNLSLGMSRKEVEKILIVGRNVEGGYIGTQFVHDPDDADKDSIMELSAKTKEWKNPNELMVIYSKTNEDPGAISIHCFLNREGRLVKFE